MRYLKRSIFMSFFVFTLCLPSFLAAQVRGGGLMVAPTRLELEGRNRSASLTLINNGSETSTYRIGTINSRMTETGARENVEDSGEQGDMFADSIIRFAPRQVRLKPGEQQTVRVMARIRPNLKEGEYRTGLNFQWIPEPGEPTIGKEESDKSEGISVNIQFSYGVTIPVIVRHGELSATGKVAEMKIETEDGNKNLLINIEREGNRSLYGDLTVYAQNDGEETEIRKMGGVAIYVPNERRIFSVRLPENALDSAQKVRVEYRNRRDAGGSLICEGTMPIN